MAYLDKSGLQYFWGKLKTLINGKADVGHGHDNASATASGFMSAADFAKLSGIAEKANNYSHPTTAGNKHVPAGGASGQILRWSADGTAVWGAENNTEYSAAGTGLGLVKSGGDVTIEDGVITVNDDSHAHTIANVDGLQTALNGKEASGAAAQALADAKEYADGIKSDLLNGAGEAYDTLKELGDLIDDNQDAIGALETVAAGKADKDHTHNYAGSSSAGGAANSANKLNTDAGSATQPVYFANGVPVKTTHTLGASVPAGAKFTDTVYTHPDSDVTAGTYRSVTVDAQGHVTAGSNPTTLSGYGITDAVAASATITNAEIDTMMAS